MSSPVIINGRLVEEDVLSVNRGFLYGDGLFETIRTQHYQPLFIEFHLERLLRGCQMLGLALPSTFNTGYLNEQIGHLVKKLDFINARVRLTLWRSSSGTYLPTENTISWKLSASNLSDPNYSCGKSLVAGLYREDVKSLSPLSTIKSLSALLSVQAARFAQANQWDDAILMNSEQRFIEGTSSGLMLRQGDVWITPPLSEGCVESVMKRVVSGLMIQNGIQVKEIPVTEKIFSESDEVILVNVIRGVMPVKKIDGNVFSEKSAGLFTEWLNEFIRSKYL